LDHATHIAHRIPNWDNDENNALKRSLYQDLNDFWKLAIQTTSSNLRQGECYSPESVGEWAKRYFIIESPFKTCINTFISLAQHNSFTTGYYFTESVHDFTRQLGYMIGLPETTEENIIMSNTSSTTTPLKTTITSTSIVGDRR
jgi:hypothetical protein